MWKMTTYIHDDALVFAVRDLTSEIIALRRQMHRDLIELHKDLAVIDASVERFIDMQKELVFLKKRKFVFREKYKQKKEGRAEGMKRSAKRTVWGKQTDRTSARLLSPSGADLPRPQKKRRRVSE